MPLPPLLLPPPGLPCSLHLNAAASSLHADLIWIFVRHWQPSILNQACCVQPRPHSGAGRPFFSTHQCSATTSGSGSVGLPLFCVQTVRGQPAVGCTAQEWASVMEKFKKAAAKVKASGAWRQRHGTRCVKWSFDNDRIHTHVETLAGLQINARNRLDLPPNSPDMHGVVERCISRLKKEFQKWLYCHPAHREMSDYQEALRDIFFNNKKVASPAVIDKQVCFMPEVYAAIASPAVRGGHPPKKYK